MFLKPTLLIASGEISKAQRMNPSPSTVDAAFQRLDLSPRSQPEEQVDDAGQFAFWKKHRHLDCCYDWYNTLWMEYYNFTDINILKWNITIRTTSEINWTLSYLVKMLHLSWHCGKWVLLISRHHYKNGQNKYVVYFDQDFSCHVLCYFP